jgi:hypothetical protein
MGTGAEQPGCHKLSARLITGVRKLDQTARTAPSPTVNTGALCERQDLRQPRTHSPGGQRKVNLLARPCTHRGEITPRASGRGRPVNVAFGI